VSAPGPDRRVFVDTSAYYAAVDRRDADHSAVAATVVIAHVPLHDEDGGEL
jgi:hypothetical protein